MLQRDFILSHPFSVCFLYVSDRSRVTPRYFGAKSCSNTSPAIMSLSVLWQPVYRPGESRSPLSSMRLGAAFSNRSTRSGVRYQETVLSRCENVSDSMARLQSSAYPTFSDSVGGRSLEWSLMYTFENNGASTDPWGKQFFKIRFRLTWLPRNTRKFRGLILVHFRY